MSINYLNIMDRAEIERAIVGGLRMTIHDKAGPITKKEFGSAAKRVFSMLQGVSRNQHGKWLERGRHYSDICPGY